jgi:hypothetical protein
VEKQKKNAEDLKNIEEKRKLEKINSFLNFIKNSLKI